MGKSSSKIKRPKALIISNENFDDPVRLKRRIGNGHDIRKLETLAAKLGVETDVKFDKNKDEIIEAINSYAKDFNGESDLAMVFVMTHGGVCGTLYAKDLPYSTVDLWKPFLNDEKFDGKLKLFVINACRGGLGEPKISVGNVKRNDVTSFGTSFPHLRDFLVAYSSTENHSSYRYLEEGSNFILYVCEVLQQIKEPIEILDFFTQVTNSVSNFATYDETDYECLGQTPVIVSSNINSYIIEPIKGASSQEFGLKSCSGVVTVDSTIPIRRHTTSVICESDGIGKPVEIPTRYTMRNPKVLLFHAQNTMSPDLVALQEKFGKLQYTSESAKLTHQTWDQLKELSQDKNLKYNDSLLVVFHTSIKENKNSSFEDTMVKIGGEFRPVSDIISYFTAKNCQFLLEKPKVFLFFEEVKKLMKDSRDTVQESPSNQPINNNVDMLVFLGLEAKILNCFSTELARVKRDENVMNILQKAMNAAQDTSVNKVPHFQSTLRLKLFVGENFLENQISILRMKIADINNDDIPTSSAVVDRPRNVFNAFRNAFLKVIPENQVSTLEREKKEVEKKLNDLITYNASEHKLAIKDYKSGDYQKALTRFNYVYESRRSLLGEDNVDTLNSLDWKADTLRELGNYNEAITIYDVVIEKRKKVLGVDHEDTLISMHNKAATLDSLGRYQDAIDLYDIVIKKQKKVLGEEHADTLQSMYNKAYTLDTMGRYQDAIDLYDIVIIKQKKVLGEKHADTLLSIYNKAFTLKRMG